MNRPRLGHNGSTVSTPMAKTMISLLGHGITFKSVSFTQDELNALNKLYGYEPEKPRERPPMPVREPDPEGTKPWESRAADEDHKRAVALWEQWEDPQPLMQAAADRNMIRHAEVDGLRLVAWLAKFIPQGADPLKTLILLADDAGLDVSPEDSSWADEEP